ncbi:hypothetical protein DITRI_Ditri05aG0047600 [Diplodiscus trichospermus]
MEHHMAQTQAWRSDLTNISFSQQAQLFGFQPGDEVGLHMAQTQAWRSDLTNISFSQQAQLLGSRLGDDVGLLFSEPNGNQLDHAGEPREVPLGQKRRGRRPILTPSEKREKKNEAGKKYRKNHKEEFDKLRAIASLFGGVEKMEFWINETIAELHRLQKMETDFHRFEQMKSQFGRTEEMESKLRKFDSR